MQVLSKGQLHTILYTEEPDVRTYVFDMDACL